MSNVNAFPEPKQGISMVTPEEAGVSEAKAEAINEDKAELVSDSLIQEVFNVYKECDAEIDLHMAEIKKLRAKKKEQTSRIVKCGIPHKSISVAYEDYKAMDKNYGAYRNFRTGYARLSKCLGLNNQKDLFDSESEPKSMFDA